MIAVSLYSNFKKRKKTDSNKKMLVKYIDILNINCYLLTRLISKNKFYFTNFLLSTKLYRYSLFAILLQGSTNPLQAVS